MDFKIGYTVRPRDIVNSVVIFEEEVETPEGVVYQDTLPTKDECLAYGFNWGGGDSSRPSVCSVNTVRDLPKPNNMLSASRLDILGADVNNTLVVGDTNQVEDFTNNSIVAGRLSKVSATNSIVLGGNSVDAGTIPLGDNLVENGDFNEIGAEEVLNGDFSEIGGELVENGSFTPGIELVENGNFQDFEDATDSNLDGGVQFADWNVNPSNGLRKLTNIVDGFRNDVIEKQTYYWQQRVNQSVSTDLEVGKYYRFKAKFTTSDGSGLSVRISEHNGANTQAGGNYPTEAGIYQKIDIFFKCTSITGQLIDVYPNEIQEIGGSFSVENVSLKEVGQDWTLGTGWSIGDGFAECDGTQSGNTDLIQNITTDAGKQYKITYTVSNYSAGSIFIRLNSGNVTSTKSSNGTFTEVLSGAGGTQFILRANLDFIGSVSNISVKEVGQDWVVVSGSLEFNNGATFDVSTKIRQPILVTGKTYKATYEVTENTGGMSLRFYNGGAYFYVNDSVGIHTVYFTALPSNTNFYISTLSGTSLTLKSISVKEVGQDWTWDSSTLFSYGSVSLIGAGAYANLLTQTSVLESGKTYEVTYTCDLSGVTSGSLKLQAFSDSSTLRTVLNGTNTVELTANGTHLYISEGGMNGTAILTNISVVEVLPYGAKRQSIQLLYGYQSTDDSNKSSFLNGITDSLFAIPENSVMYFHADVIAVRVGGVHATGAVGDYGSWVERGVIINKSGVLSINRERDTIKSSGTVTGWIPTAIVNDTNFAIRVRGHADMTIEWASNITFTEIITGVAL